MKKYGLLGFPLGHSFSKGFFTAKFEKENIKASYHNFAIENITHFKQILTENKDLCGLNVTIPYKEQIIPYLSDLDKTAEEIGAVNTIKFIKEKDELKLKGYNSDIYGFEKSISPFLTARHNKALILGTGGASKAIKYVLEKLNIEYISASIEELKDNEISYEDITTKLIKNYPIIINATPLGTYPNIKTCPKIPYNAITEEHLLYDLVYNPELTEFLKRGKKQKATTTNGLKMLQMQAEKSWEIWNM